MRKWKRRKKYSVVSSGTAEDTSVLSSFRLTRLLKREMVLTAISVLVVSSIVLGSSYAVLTNISKAEDYNIVKTGTLQIAYDDTSEGLGNIIRLNGAYPESDEDGQKEEPYRFKITNTGSIATEYKVKILDDVSMIEEDHCQDKLLDKSRLKYSIDGEVPVILSTVGEEYVVTSGTLGAGESITIEVRMWIDEASGNEVLGKHYHGKIVVEGVQSDGEMAVKFLKKRMNDASLTYDNATEDEKKEMFTFTHTAGEQQTGWSEEELTDYRYVGTTPNNYVTFNDEVWRIIGIFTVEDENGRKEQRLKIIRNESIGDYSWDNKGENGENDWSQGALQQVLNSGSYYNRTIGNCPYDDNDVTITCDFRSTGLTIASKNMIEKIKWYLGGVSNAADTLYDFYKNERGLAVFNGRPNSWVGEIGLMYASDYGYAVGKDSCFANQLSDGCYQTNWLFDKKKQEWTITSYKSNSIYAIAIFSYGTINLLRVPYLSMIRPTVYLKSNVTITSGDGSSDHPYSLSLSS